MEFCSVCLCSNRYLQPLGDLQETFDKIVQRVQGNLPAVVLCFECCHLLKKCVKFKKKADHVQKMFIAHSLDGSYESFFSNKVVNEISPFSSLAVTYKDTFDYIFSEETSKDEDGHGQSSDSFDKTTDHSTNIQPSTSKIHIKQEIDSEEECSLKQLRDRNYIKVKVGGVYKKLMVVKNPELISKLPPKQMLIRKVTSAPPAINKEIIKLPVTKTKLVKFPVEKIQIGKLSEKNLTTKSSKGKIQITKLPVTRKEIKTIPKLVEVAAHDKYKKDINYSTQKKNFFDPQNKITSFYFGEAKDADDVPSVEEISQNFTRVLTETLSKNFEVKVMNTEELSFRRQLMRQESHFVNSEHTCVPCIIGYYSEDQLLDHNKAKHTLKAGSIKCPICSCFTPASLYKFHYARHFVVYICNHCDYATDEAKSAGTHYKSQHVERSMEAFPCPDCYSAFPSARGLLIHKRKCHELPIDVACKICHKRYTSMISYQTHLKLHEMSPIQCKICNKICKNELTYKTHCKLLHAATPGEKVRCEECDIEFKNYKNYRTHLATAKKHSNGYKFICAVCGSGFMHKHLLEDHVGYRHEGKSRYVCNTCGKSFSSGSGLFRHRRFVHEGARPAKNKECKVCGMKFQSKQRLLEHGNSHSGARPHACRQCGATFRQRAALYTHTRRLHRHA